MGSPIVFHTAPPPPASKARITCSLQLDGGAEASQKGFGHLMPQNVVSRVGLTIELLAAMLHLQPGGNSYAGALAVRDSVDNLTSSVRAITACEELRMRGLPGSSVDDDTATVERDLRSTARLGEKGAVRRLPNGEDD